WRKSGNDLQEIKALISMADCQHNLRNFSTGLRHLARAVLDYRNSLDPAVQFFVDLAKKKFWDMLTVRIEPSVPDVPLGEKKEFRAILVYQDGKELYIPPEYISWDWEVRGNDGDGHEFEFENDHCFYTGGRLPFSNIFMKAHGVLKEELVAEFISGRLKIKESDKKVELKPFFGDRKKFQAEAEDSEQTDEDDGF
ncbi:MAG: hypothetical protein PHQ23_10845, partial [Candidatus Wallbacteria bacterium]|nr:hypothetical protein [Candidatus Wallbacteria bacterium]